MNYVLTSIDTHLDFGFGVTADSYFDSAEFLNANKKEIKTFQQTEMPIGFLYRHSIELFLKSLIIIFYKVLQLPYDDQPYDSDKPKVLIQGQWVDLYNCHLIDELYNYWLNELLLKHAETIKKLAPKEDWAEYKAATKLFGLIAGYDRDSQYFRYPATKNKNADIKKQTMKKIDLKNLQKEIEKPKTQSNDKTKLFLVLSGENDEVSEAFKRDNDVLSDVNNALRKAAQYLQNMHTMSRVTLCKGE